MLSDMDPDEGLEAARTVPHATSRVCEKSFQSVTAVQHLYKLYKLQYHRRFARDVCEGLG